MGVVEVERNEKTLVGASKLAFLVLLALLPWMKHGVTFQGLEAFPVDLLFVICGSLWAAALVMRQAPLRLHWSFLALAIYFAAMAASAIFSVDRGTSAFKLLTQAYLLLLAVLAFNLIETETDFRRALAWWRAAAVAVGAYGVATILLFPFVGWHSFLLEPLHHFGTLAPGPYPRIELTFEYPAMLANYLGVSLMLVLIAQSYSWIGRRAATVCAAALLVSAFFALTPSFGGVWAMLGLWVWYRQRERRPELARAAFIAGVGLIGLEMLVAALTPIIGPTAPFLIHLPGSSISMAPAVRLLAWMAAVHNFLTSPLFGHGIGVGAVSVLYQAPEDASPGYVTDAHNFILNIAAQCGILGVAAVTAIVLLVVRQARGATLQHQYSPLVFGLSIAWLSGFLIQGLVGSFEDARHLWILFGLIASASRLEAYNTGVAPIVPMVA